MHDDRRQHRLRGDLRRHRDAPGAEPSRTRRRGRRPGVAPPCGRRGPNPASPAGRRGSRIRRPRWRRSEGRRSPPAPFGGRRPPRLRTRRAAGRCRGRRDRPGADAMRARPNRSVRMRPSPRPTARPTQVRRPSSRAVVVKRSPSTTTTISRSRSARARRAHRRDGFGPRHARDVHAADRGAGQEAVGVRLLVAERRVRDPTQGEHQHAGDETDDQRPALAGRAYLVTSFGHGEDPRSPRDRDPERR